MIGAVDNLPANDDWRAVLDSSRRWAVVCGDCLDVMRQMPDGCVDAVVTDPPYGVDLAEWDASIPPREVLDECLRLSRGPVVWFGGSRPDALAAVSALSPDRCLSWSPMHAMARAAASRIFFCWHPVWVWRPPTSQDAIHQDIIRDSHEVIDGERHPAQKPIRLMRRLVRASTSESATVLDPFLGSGTTAVAALAEGRRVIGIEREPDYCAIARARIEPKGALL